MSHTKTIVRHWFPRITRCPLSRWPDLVWFSCEFDGFAEIYGIRDIIAYVVPHGKKEFMEDLARKVLNKMPSNCKSVTVRLIFNRHTATVTRD